MTKFFDDEEEFNYDLGDADSADITDEDIYADETEDYFEDLWAEELKYKLENALEIWIASAYLDFRAVDILKATLKNIPKGDSREVRILLDNQFHSNAVAREVMINKMYQIPNIKIRLADTKGKFHPKCYVFNDGSLTSCLVGSMNFTGNAMERSVEFGLFFDGHEQTKRCKDFFRKHWSKSNEALKTSLTEFIGNKFKVSERVKYLKTGKSGVILKLHHVANENTYIYSVFFNDEICIEIPELDLEGIHISTPSVSNISSFPSIDTTDDIKKIIYAYLYSRYFLPCENGMYISNNSRIIETWYQKIPLLKIMSSKRPKLLIADEVGLGKTIEAGLIIREMLSKMPLCRKTLILCPNNLVNKWEAEMRLRFDLFFDIYTGKNAIHFIEKWNKKQIFKAIIPYESIRKSEIQNIVNELKTPIDILVCDEAHNLRNDDSLQHQSVRSIAKDNRCMLMLTATPINLSNQDLRVLLGLLDPNTYKYLDTSSWENFKIPNIFISRLYSEISDCLDTSNSSNILFSQNVFEFANDLNNCILNSMAFKPNYPPNHPLRHTINKLNSHPLGEPFSAQATIDFLEKLQFSNVFSQSIIRTLKKDVGEFNKRKVSAIKVKLKYKEEQKLFDQSVKDIKKHFKKNKKKLAAHKYLAMLSSCLPMFNVFSKTNKHSAKNPLHSIERKNNNDITEQVLTSKDSKYEELKRIIQKAKEEDGENFKIVIFCIYRKTIRYLQRRIDKEFGKNTIDAVYGGVSDVNQRYEIIRKFREQKKPNILLCSEVASEGVDLQTCRILVNYDLPWNPTKVEQRIGRIDRFGQESDVVYIYNLIIENTVEEAIYYRLGERLEDAKNTLGPVAEVLGKLEDNLPEIFFNKELTDDEKDVFLNRIDLNIRRAKREENKLENRCLNLSAIGQKKMVEKWKIVQHLIDHQNKIGKYLVLLEKDIFRLRNHTKGDELRILDTKKSKLIKQLMQYLYKKNSKKKFLHIKSLINKKRLDVVFSHDDAMKSGGEFLNINHPIIKSQILSNGKKMQKNIMHCLETVSDYVPAGKYFILEYESSINLDSIKYDSCFYEIAFVFNGGALSVVTETKILSVLFDFTKWQGIKSIDISSSIIKEAEGIAIEKAGDFFLDQYKKIKGKINNELQLKRDSLESMQSKNKLRLQAQLENTSDPNTKEIYVQALKEINDDINISLHNIPSDSSIKFSIELLFCSKIIKI
jgi:superfamily II DNA or RNA helicase/HKD family nuclease